MVKPGNKFRDFVTTHREKDGGMVEGKEVKRELCASYLAYIPLARISTWPQQGAGKSEKRSFYMGGHLLRKVQEGRLFY